MKDLIISELNPKLNPVLITSDKDLPQLEAFLAKTDTFVLDTETNVVEHVFDRRVRVIQIGNKDVQYVIDLLGFSRNLSTSQGNYRHDAKYTNLVTLLKKHLETNKSKKVLFNALFDYT